MKHQNSISQYKTCVVCASSHGELVDGGIGYGVKEGRSWSSTPESILFTKAIYRCACSIYKNFGQGCNR